MKKKYEKPQVYMEKFELSHNVASCDYKLGAADTNTCSIVEDNCKEDCEDFTGGFVSKPICSELAPSIYCYDAGEGTLPTVFTS